MLKQLESSAKASKKLARTGQDAQLVKQLRNHWLGRIALNWCGRRN